jgi:hypothetical protein
MSSDHPSKRIRAGDGAKPGAASSIHPDQHQHQQKMIISLLEGKIHELQSIHFNTLQQAERSNYPRPTAIYTDPLINYQFAVMRYKEQELYVD